MWLEQVRSPDDLTSLTYAQLDELSEEIRAFIIDVVTSHGGHLGSNLGAVELTIALHRIFRSPRDIILFDTGHQAYVHKLLTGRMGDFPSLRRPGGLSGYPNRRESEHDWIENSHASTALSYAYGLAASLRLGRGPLAGSTQSAKVPGQGRRVVALVGDGALTGGMAYEALNNIGHSQAEITIIWNDNGRSYAPTISRLSQSITKIRLHPSYIQARSRLGRMISELPAVGGLASSSWTGLTGALREAIEPRVFFEALGVRYVGPVDGHDIAELEYALEGAAEWNGPIVVHVLTQKGRGYGPAEDDEINCLHDLKVPQVTKVVDGEPLRSYTEEFSRSLLTLAAQRPEVVAVTAAMPGPTGLLGFAERFPDRFFDVGIAEQHAVTSAAGMAMGGLRPVVAIYSTFLSRAFDQINLDVGLHGAPVVFAIDRAGVTGEDGPSHHGVVDMVQMLSIPNMVVFAPSSTDEMGEMLRTALELPGPSSIRFPKTPGLKRIAGEIGSGCAARKILAHGGRLVLIGVGKMVAPTYEVALSLVGESIPVDLWDPRCLQPLDQEMIDEVAGALLVVTVEDGFLHGGAGQHIASALRNVRQDLVVVNLGLETDFLPHGNADALLADAGLDAQGIRRSVVSSWESVNENLLGAQERQPLWRSESFER
jgi:1-deoxy-D-xylulose-5-phosphate synthase